MSSSFGSLNIGYSGLVAQKLGLDVTGNNIANASTDGYHRQQVNMTAAPGTTQPSMWAVNDGTGLGVQVDKPTRADDQFLTQRSLQQNATNSYLSEHSSTLTSVEDAFGEPSDSGLSATMGKFWSSWSDLSNSPSDGSARTMVLTQASTLAGQLNSTSSSLANLWTADQSQLATLAQTTTSTAQQVATLNGQILAAKNGNGDANELEDKRDVLVKNLAQTVGATSTTMADGTVNITVGGQMLVTGDTSRALSVAGATNAGSPLASNSVSLVLADQTPTVTLSNVGGTAGALLDAVNTTIPKYSGQLDSVANLIATKVNTQQAAGYDQNGVAGTPIFSGTTAGTINVVMTDPTKVAASSVTPASGGDNAATMATFASGAGTPYASYKSMIGDLAIESQNATSQSTTQQSLTTQADSALQASTGVDIDEETVNLVKYQTAYSAAAKYISTIDQTLQDLLSMVG